MSIQKNFIFVNYKGNQASYLCQIARYGDTAGNNRINPSNQAEKLQTCKDKKRKHIVITMRSREGCL